MGNGKKMWGVVIDTDTISDFKKKYLELCVYASENGLDEPLVGDLAQKMLSKENLEKIKPEEYFTK